jgi:hypothetical protein
MIILVLHWYAPKVIYAQRNKKLPDITMSVADILRNSRCGNWLRSADLIKLYAKEEEISERQAIRRIKSALDRKEILSKVVPTRPPHTYYGLPEFLPIKEQTTQEGKFTYVVPFQGYREYREIFERLTRLEDDEDLKSSDLKKMLTSICLGCTRQLEKPPALPDLCRPCMERKTTLYSLTKKQLGGCVTVSQLSEAIKFYLISEYKRRLFDICYRELKEAKSTMHLEAFNLCAQATYDRLNRLRFYDSSLEPKVPMLLVGSLLDVDSGIGQKIISTAMNAVKWHLVEQALYDPSEALQDRFRQACQDWDELYYKYNKSAWKDS